MKGKEIMDMLKGKEDVDIELNVKFFGRTVTISGGDIYLDMIEESNKGFLTVDTKNLNTGFDFDDGKGNEWKKR